MGLIVVLVVQISHIVHLFARYTPFSENEFFDTIFEPIYERDKALSDPTVSHRLAVLFMALALGALLDLNRPPLSSDAMQYYQLGRAALALESVLEEQSVTAVQALVGLFSALLILFYSYRPSCSYVTSCFYLNWAHRAGL